MKLTIEILNHSVLNLLKELEGLKLLRFFPSSKKAIEQKPKPKKFQATSLNTMGFSFNRDEANER